MRLKPSLIAGCLGFAASALAAILATASPNRPSKPATPIAQATPQQPAAATVQQQCDPNYTGACTLPCSQVGDLDCKAIPEPIFQSIGSGPHQPGFTIGALVTASATASPNSTSKQTAPIAKATAQQLVEERKQQLVEERAQQLVEERAQQLVEERAQQLVEERTQQLAEETAQQLIEETQQLAEETAQQLAEETAQQLAEETAQQLAEEEAQQQCEPNYAGACIPPYDQVGDLDCKDISEQNFQSIGSDPHRLDRDNDGIACER